MTYEDMLSRYELVVGMEVHTQLNTKTKLFCGCELEFAAAPNSRTCPVCLGLPGTLPVLNGEALSKVYAISLALGCDVRLQTEFDRKSYYYPDLPKGYQTSQMYDNVGGGDGRQGGSLKLLRSGMTIRMHNVHIEEDAGKLAHVEGAATSAVDLNRAGTPLAEIVTEPDFHSVDEVDDYMDTLTELLRALNVSHCRMQEGNVRFEASVSVRPQGETELRDRCEIKNLNSYAAVRKAVTYEYARQVALLEAGKAPRQETRLWDADELDPYEAGVPEEHKVPRGRVRALLPQGKDPWCGQTRFMRSKEDAHDYRYFPEPDMPAFAVTAEVLDALRAAQPELPGVRRERYVEALGLAQKPAEVLARDYPLAAFFERLIELGVPAPTASNYTLNQVSAVLNKAKVGAADCPVPPEHVAGLHELIESDNGLSKDLVLKQVWPKVISEGLAPAEVIVKYSIEGVSDSAVIEATDRAWASNPKAVRDLLDGKKKAVGAIVGAVMRELKGKASPQVINARVAELLTQERQKGD